MAKEIKNLGASVRARLLKLSKENGQSFDLVLTRFACVQQQEDCSWYASCDMGHLEKVGAHYESEAVTGKGASNTPSGQSDPLFAMPCAW